MKNLIFLLFILALLSPVLTSAKNIDLSTLPDRDAVQLTIYNAEDLTLVRETRQISIKKGRNLLQFSWANTRIDPTSVQLRFVSHPGQMVLGNTRYPHDKPQMLYWHIQSQTEALATVEISYFTSGISWQADYTAILNQSGNAMKLESFVTVTNHSGEDYSQAEIRLVLGEINLVESVNALVREADVRKEELSQRRQVKKMQLARQMLSKNSGQYYQPAPVLADAMDSEKAISKESISEYYIFSIEGRETVKNGWSKRLRSSQADAVAVDTVYRYRPREYGEQLVRVLQLHNNKDSKLGEAPLPQGTIQIYQDNKEGSLSYIAGLQFNYVAIGEKAELNTGVNPQLYFQLVNLKNWRDNIWMYYRKGKVYRRVGDGHMIVDHNATVAGWDEHRIYVQKLRNFTGKPVKVEIRRRVTGDAVIKSSLDMKKHDFQTFELQTALAPGEQQALLYEMLIKKGRNARQNQIVLQKKPIAYPVW